MANYDARINISANSGPAITAIQEIQNRLDRVNRAAQINFGERVSLGGLERALRTVNQVENAVISLRSTTRSLSAPGGGNLGDAFRVAATEANRFFDSLVRGDRQLSNTISGLNEQARAFATLAANIDSADRRFTDYIQGAQAAQDKGLRPLFRQLEALRRLYQESVTGMGTDIQSPQMGATFFERLRDEVPNTVKALQAYRGELERIQSLIESGSVADIGVQQELLRVEQQLLDIEQQRLELRTALRGETSPQVQSALGRMEGRGADPLGVSDDQINESLNARAEQYVRQQRELGSLQQVLGAMEGKRYDPLNVTDEQINAALNERAVQYQKQEEELSSLQRVLSAMEGKRYDPLNISDAQINQGLNERASEYQRQQQELLELQRVLAAMEGQKYNPFGITDSQVNAGLDERAAIYQQQSRDMAALQQALGSMEGNRVDWATVFGIQEADIAARRANELEAEWKKLQAAADALAAQAPQTAAALKAFEFKTRAEDANAYTRALLNQQRTLDEYADSASRAARAASGLGYGGELPALRPAGFTSQDVRIKNLLDDEVKSAQIVADLEMELDKIVTFAEIENVQKAYDYEIDRIEQNLKARIKADDAFWDAAKRNIDENDKRTREGERQNALPFLERKFGKRGSAAISEGLIGGAFPLLFGQGLGASVGGGLGGAVGGFAGGGLGFGLSLIGTALGTAFDTAIQAATEFGAALNDVSTVFGKTKERSLFSSREIEKYATKLEEAGFVASASTLAQQEIIKKIGVSGVERLKDLESSSDRLNRAWAELNLQLQAALAGPMAGLLEWVANIVAEGNKVRRGFAEIEDVRSGLSDADRREFDRKASEIEILSKLPGLNPKRITREQAVERQVALAREFAPRARKTEPVKLAPELVRDELVSQAKGQIDALNTQLEAIDIGKKLTDQLREADRQQEDLNQQAFDTRRQYEEAIGDIRLNIERTVQRESLDAIRAQNELYQVQGEIRLQQLSNANQALISEQGVNDYGRRLFEILGQAASLEVSTQQDIENRKRQFQLEMQSKELETEIFKGDIAKQVAKLNEDSEKRIADINKNVRRANEQYDQQRFKIEKAISDLKVKQIEAEIQFNEETVGAQLKQAQLEPSTDPKTIRYFQNLLSIYQAQSEALEKSKTTLASVTAPPKLQEVGGISTQGVSTAAYDAVRERAVAASRALLEANQGLISLARAGSWQEIKDQFVELADQGYKGAVIELQDIVEAVRNGGDAFAGAAARLAEADRKVTESLNSIGKQSETSLIKKYREGGLADEQISLLLQLASQTNLLARAQLDGARTAEFYSDSISAVQSQIESLTQEIKEATAFGTNYEKALRDLAERGLGLADKEARDLLDSAKQLDILQDRADTLKNIRTASEGLTGSLRGLIENFYELGSASKALEAFNKEMSQKALNLVLDIAFRPVEENIRKSLIMFGEKVGLNFKTPVEQQLTELQKANATITSIKTGVDALVSKIVASQPAQATTSVAPGSQAAQVVTGPASQRTAGLPIDYVNSVVSSQSPQIKARLQSATTVDEVLTRGEAIKREYLDTTTGFNIADPATRSQLNKLLNDLVLEGIKNRADEIRKFTGQGGPIESFPMSADPDADLPVPSQLRGTASLADEFSNSIRPIPSTLRDATSQINSTSAQTTEELRRQNAAVAQVVPQWQKNLGGVVTGLGLATTGVIGILGGIQQIQQGGTASVLSGIGGILTTVGSIGLSVAGMFGGGGGLGGIFGGGSGGAAGASSAINFGKSITGFAKGGVVKSPTLFQFADGGQFGVMGEAGAEAVMPLKRGPDGRLGVEQVSEGGDSSGRLREAMGRSPAQGGQPSEVRIKFETTVINGVEYVSKDQLDRAMEKTRKASISEGAKRGMGMTLDKLKQSPSTRSRVGIR